MELTAVCTTKADSAEAARQAYGARSGVSTITAKMIASPEIDAVAVVVRVPSHYAPTKAALEAGKHVYCEWPLGPHDVGGRGTGGVGKGQQAGHGGRPAGPRQSRRDVHEGTGREPASSAR